MMTDDISALMYHKIGRHFTPQIHDNVMQHGRRKLAVLDGRCERTGREGKIVHWANETTHTKTLTSIDLVWMLVRHNIKNKEGEIKPQRVGAVSDKRNDLVIVTGDGRALTNISFAQPLPGVTICQIDEILRMIADLELQRYAFVGFPRSTDILFARPFRWSIGDRIEVNGNFQIDDIKVVNGTLDLSAAKRLATIKGTLKQLSRLHRLLQKDVKSDAEWDEMQKLAQTLDVSIEQAMALRTSTWDDVRLSRRFAYDRDPVLCRDAPGSDHL